MLLPKKPTSRLHSLFCYLQSRTFVNFFMFFTFSAEEKFCGPKAATEGAGAREPRVVRAPGVVETGEETDFGDPRVKDDQTQTDR